MNTSSIYRVEKQARGTKPTPSDRMEAIACGVQARFEESTGYSKKVTDETVNVARSLGVSDSEIQRWASQRFNRLARETERLREIKSLLERVYGKKAGMTAGS
jgi:hypothetical protein